ncbi:MAG: hypothetical protein QOJ99_3523 [Bryobacterales bacterium]|jgi:hypothetical protein|nr:hypothetical protein [Bryobacterales bacterium]
MDDIDIDEIAEVNYPDDPSPGAQDHVEVRFKDGTTRIYSGPEVVELLEVLKHWTPPTA